MNIKDLVILYLYLFINLEIYNNVRIFKYEFRSPYIPVGYQFIVKIVDIIIRWSDKMKRNPGQ
jgi:hypothetical protein